MTINNNNLFKDKFTNSVIIIIILIITIVLFMSKSTANKEIESIKYSNYVTFSNNIKHTIHTEIENKKKINSLIAITLAKDLTLINALKTNNRSLIKLEEYIKQLDRLTDYKNIWFQLIDKNGKSFFRSWTKKYGDDMLKARIDIKKMIDSPKVMSTISVGKYAMTFKSMIPIYDKNQFLGIF